MVVTTISSTSPPTWFARALAAREAAGATGTASRRRWASSSTDTSIPGTRKASVARASSHGMNSAARRGPTAKPALPPTMNHASPVAGRPPDSRLVTRAASGWKAATPSPEPTMHAISPTYPPASPAAVNPCVATATPPHRNAGLARRSARMPKNGWMADDTNSDAPRIMLAARSLRAYRAVKTGISAGTAPTVASIMK